jgi:hypothetical protein
MSDPIVAVAKYSNVLEAQLAKGYLEAEGIEARLTGDQAAGLQMGALGGLVELYVRDSDAERAAELLAEHFDKAELDDDWKERTEDDAEVWVCSLCGASVSDDLDTCDGCETPRGAIQTKDAVTRQGRRPRPQRSPAANDQGISKPGATTTEAPEPVEPPQVDHGIDVLDVRLYLGDDVAKRALIGALLGFICWLLTAYSLYCLLKLAFADYEITPKGQVRCYAALAINIIHGSLWFALFLSRIWQ